MNSGRIALGFLITAVIVITMFFGVAKLPAAYAATNSNGTTTAQVIVNGLVSITLTNVPIQFTAMDPGTADVAANSTGGWPMGIQDDGATNAGVDVFMNGSQFVSGANNFGIGMMHFNVSNSSTGFVKNVTCWNPTHPCNYTLTTIAIFNETARLGNATITNISNWITVPIGQAPGTYANAVKVCAQQWGTSGC